VIQCGFIQLGRTKRGNDINAPGHRLAPIQRMSMNGPLLFAEPGSQD
jgi:hypothetical protein